MSRASSVDVTDNQNADPEPDTRFAPGRLSALVRRGIGWKLASGAVAQVVRVVTAVVIARLLSPDDFGLAAIVLVLSGLATIVTDLALGSALVQRRSITESDRSTAFWASVGIGAGLTAVFVAASWPLAAFYGEPSAQPLFAVFAFTFLLAGLATTQAALLTRAMSFRALELRVIVATVLSAAVGIWMAVAGAGAWALILQSLTYAGSSVLLLWAASPWRPRLLFSRSSVRNLGGFGLKVLGSRLVWFANTSTDTILIGRFLGPTSLGAYAIAFNLMLFPISRIVAPLGNVVFPAFSRIQDERSRLRAGWLHATRLLAAVVAPLMIGMVLVAPDFVPVVLGTKWDAAIPVIQLLAWVGLLQALQRMSGSALTASDRAGVVLRWTIVAFVANIVAFVVGLSWGIVGVAVGYAVATTLVFLAFSAVTARALDSSLPALGRSLGPPLLAALAMAVSVGVARRALIAADVGEEARLVLLVALGAAVYVPLLLWRAPDVTAELRNLLRSRSAASVSS